MTFLSLLCPLFVLKRFYCHVRFLIFTMYFCFICCRFWFWGCLRSSVMLMISCGLMCKDMVWFMHGILNSLFYVAMSPPFIPLCLLVLICCLAFLTMLCFFFMCYRFDAFLTFLWWKMRLTISSWKGMGNKLDFKIFYCCLSSSQMMLLILWLI